MAEIVLNPDTGMYDAVGSEGEVIYDGGVNADTEIPDSVAPDSETSEDVLDDSEDSVVLEEAQDSEDVPILINPMSVVDNEAAFTPRDWQINLAENRDIGDHYLLWAVRSSGSYSRWTYYLALGSDIQYDNDVYTYNNVDLYSYYDNGNTVRYELQQASGSVDGSSSLVYSDLYFDYVGSVPGQSPFVLVCFAIFILIFVMLIVRRH